MSQIYLNIRTVASLFHRTLAFQIGFAKNLNSRYNSHLTYWSLQILSPKPAVITRNNELTDPEFAGFGEFGAVNNSESELNLKTNFIAHLESGIKLMLENSQSLYMGLFLDYGLNDIKPDGSQDRLIDYTNQNPTAFAFGSLLSSRREMNSEQYVDEVRTLAFGLKIQYAFQF